MSYNSEAYERESSRALIDEVATRIDREHRDALDRLMASIPPRLNSLIMEVSAETEKPEPWLDTGLGPLDYLLDGGIRGGEVFVLAARPSVGKSAFALQVALHVAQQVPVAVWSLEMKPKAWIRRAICSLSGISPKRLRRGEMREEESALFVQAANELGCLDIHFAVGDTTPSGFAEEAARQAEENQCGLLVIDYLQLMQPEKGAYNRENEVATASRTIKQVALRENVCVLLLAQCNRNAEGKAPNLSDLRESGSVEQDADEVFFLHRERDWDSHVLGASGVGILAKNRDGEAGSFSLRYDGPRYKFYPIDRIHEAPTNGRRAYEP